MLLVGAGVVVAVGAQSAAAAADWSIQPAPRPPHAGDVDLLGVSCASTHECMAVGQWLPPSTLDPVPLVEHWNGARWSIERTPIAADRGWVGALSAVSCSSGTACTAVGFSFDDESGMDPLTERWNGSTWSIQRTPPLLDASEFDDVSCTSTADCTAVGAEGSVARWNGERWSTEQSPFVGSLEADLELLGVSCPSVGTCAVVGADDIGSCDGYGDYFVPVFGFWRSGAWSVTRHPKNLGCGSGDDGGGNGLNAVSCTSSSACTAVGSEVYRWDGRRWKIQEARLRGDILDGVSCTASTTCTAVGSHIYDWNGRSWRSEPMPSPAHAAAATLNSVSCVSPDSCVAVGTYANRAGQDFPLAESIGISVTEER